ncbi:hypothetical protein IW261DRAFT_1420861 [Armillaria novae-zelandiae]|uniref:Uncharacterized protein n=1 Tax=Armillaria novae-zelandiae TaxID=153914 RepID=A0AA39P4Q8_9AGAR|nr:hypothetical protein IW261DRAFT_1420861 [Armillaria novae-zelandiae]
MFTLRRGSCCSRLSILYCMAWFFFQAKVEENGMNVFSVVLLGAAICLGCTSGGVFGRDRMPHRTTTPFIMDNFKMLEFFACIVILFRMSDIYRRLLPRAFYCCKNIQLYVKTSPLKNANCNIKGIN